MKEKIDSIHNTNTVLIMASGLQSPHKQFDLAML